MKNADFALKIRKSFLAQCARREVRRAQAKAFGVLVGVVICGSTLGSLLAARG